MSGRVTARLRELGITLAEPPNPAANYIPARRSGSLLFVAGQVPKADGKDQFVADIYQVIGPDGDIDLRGEPGSIRLEEAVTELADLPHFEFLWLRSVSADRVFRHNAL